MFKIFAIVLMAVAYVVAKPAVVAYSSPVVAAPVVTATSSQYFARNYNGLAVSPAVAYTAPAVAAYSAPAVAAYSAPAVAAYSAYSAPAVAAYTAPVAYSAYTYV